MPPKNRQKFRPLTHAALLATMATMRLILASTSPYRANQLKRMGLAFKSVAPKVDEDALKIQEQHLSAKDLSKFLATAKAKSLRADFMNQVIVGADQIAEFNGAAVGKPGTEDLAVTQLMTLQGKWHTLVTSMTLFYAEQELSYTSTTKIKLHTLSESEARAYVRRDRPLDCAGSYKIECAGWSLISEIQSDDPSAIEGLGLIDLSKGLREFGFSLNEFWDPNS